MQVVDSASVVQLQLVKQFALQRYLIIEEGASNNVVHISAHLEDAVSKGGDDAANGAGNEGAVGLKHQVGNGTDGHAAAQRGVLDVDNFKPLAAETKYDSYP